MVPFLALLGAIEISKSNIYGMWEIEQSSRTTLVKIVAGRMLIIGVINLFLITVILISMAYIYQKSMIEMVLYGLIPFNISCTCYLFICAKSRTNDSLYHLIACMIFLSGTFSLPPPQNSGSSRAALRAPPWFETAYGYLLLKFYSLLVSWGSDPPVSSLRRLTARNASSCFCCKAAS